MSACDRQSFSNVTETAWNCLINKAKGSGIPITDAHSGRATKDGFTVTWNYDSDANTLAIQCTDSPWWAPCSMINDKINELVNECL